MTRFQILLVVLLWVTCASDNLAAQTATPPRDTAKPVLTGTGTIRGRVVAAVTNTPLHRAQVMLRWAENPDMPRVAQTDAQGRYEFVELPAGKFSLDASIPGYIALQYGQRRPFEAGTAIPLRDAETATAIDFALPRGSVIAGRVTDERGQPVVQAQVQVRRFQYRENGQRSLAPVRNTTTDDRGDFRVFGLMPGEYIVDGSVRNGANLPGVATNPNETFDGFQPTFYPGTPNAAEAQPISLAIAEEANVQFALTPSKLVRVTGAVRDSQGRPLYPAEVAMWTKFGDMYSVAPGGSTSSLTSADGSFAFA